MILITNGFAQLNGEWGWQPTDDGCTGNVNVKVKNLDMHKVTGVLGTKSTCWKRKPLRTSPSHVNLRRSRFRAGP
eukprot:5252023-Amphidinium_carterae.1